MLFCCEQACMVRGVITVGIRVHGCFYSDVDYYNLSPPACRVDI